MGRNVVPMEPLPPELERKRRALSRSLGRPVTIRGIRTQDAAFRGRLRVEPARVVIEYQVAQQGYFWHIPIIEELLSRAARGETRAELSSPGDDPSAPPAER